MNRCLLMVGFDMLCCTCFVDRWLQRHMLSIQAQLSSRPRQCVTMHYNILYVRHITVMHGMCKCAWRTFPGTDMFPIAVNLCSCCWYQALLFSWKQRS